MKTILILIFLISLIHQPPYGYGGNKSTGSLNYKEKFLIAQGKALEKRKEKVIHANDELIQQTLKAHGGNYFRQGKSKVIIFKEKVYKDFSVRVVNGEYIIIETKDGIYRLETERE